MIDKYCRECFYDFDWKKDSCTYVSRELKENKVLDASLIVNQNNDVSGMDYSYEGEGDENDENNQQENNKKKQMKKNNEIFVGEDQQQIEEEKKVEENNKKEKKDKNKDDKPKDQKV